MECYGMKGSGFLQTSLLQSVRLLSLLSAVDRFPVCFRCYCSRRIPCLLQTGIAPEFILFFDCPEEVMEKRLLGRNQVSSRP